jgi:small subunit ribosomal protein S21
VVEIRLEENEPIDNALKRFKKVVQNSGLISEMKKREFYEKPSERRKKREAAARKKARRRAMKFNRDLLFGSRRARFLLGDGLFLSVNLLSVLEAS